MQVVVEKACIGGNSRSIPYKKHIKPRENSRFLTMKLFGMTTFQSFFNNLPGTVYSADG